MDIGVRQETLTTMPGQPVLVQLPLIPAYALTVHKTQAGTAQSDPPQGVTPLGEFKGTSQVKRNLEEKLFSIGVP